MKKARHAGPEQAPGCPAELKPALRRAENMN